MYITVISFFFYSVIRDNPQFAGINEGALPTPDGRMKMQINVKKTIAPNHPLTLTSSADNSTGQLVGYDFVVNYAIANHRRVLANMSRLYQLISTFFRCDLFNTVGFTKLLNSQLIAREALFIKIH